MQGIGTNVNRHPYRHIVYDENKKNYAARAAFGVICLNINMIRAAMFAKNCAGTLPLLCRPRIMNREVKIFYNRILRQENLNFS